MTPIINPWAIYLISRLDAIKDLIDYASFFVFLCIAGIALVQCLTTETMEEWIEHMKKSCAKKLCIIFACLFIIESFIPDTHTGFMLFTAHYITEENINKGIDFIKEATDHAIEEVNKLNN